ncbi:hypothetical protein ACHAXR_005745 [Thalassiosira sp. AJA248-18]
MSEELGELIRRDVELLQSVGFSQLVETRRGRGDFASLNNVVHPARRLLKLYKHRGVPVKFSTEPWTSAQVHDAILRGPHKSCLEYIDFLEEEFVDMIKKGQWLILPASVASSLPHLRVSPPGVVPQRERRPRWICDYTWSNVNHDTLPLVATESMQFGHALERILREILLANPNHGPVYLNKTDLSDGFYRVGLNVGDIPKLGVVFPTRPGDPPLVALPLVTPMGWKNSPPSFSTATETIADMTNTRLQQPVFQPPHHHLDDLAESATKSDVPPDAPVGPGLSSVPLPDSRDPCLPTTTDPLQYVDIFVDDFVSLAQRPFLRRVRRTLLQAVDQVFRPVDPQDNAFRREPVSLKKLKQGDCSWNTIKLVLGWIVDTVNMTIRLPPHRIDRLWELLNSIPANQKRTSVKKWHKILGELRSMSIAIPGSRNMFGRLQKALSDGQQSKRITLKKGVHQALDDFRWLAKDLATRPTRIGELIPLSPVADGHHDASGAGAGGVWYPGDNIRPREGTNPAQPVLWRLEWPQWVRDALVSSDNPLGTITNSDLELAGGLLHLACIVSMFDVRERTVLSRGDNLNTTFWERKGSTTTDSVPAYLLRLFGLHQRYHRYVPRFDYLAGASNLVADALSRDFHLSWPDLYSRLASCFPQNNGYQRDMITISFFFLLRPGEYTDSPSDTIPFTWGDVQLSTGPLRLDLDTISDAQILDALSSALTFFTNQKNGVKMSGDPYLLGLASGSSL